MSIEFEVDLQKLAAEHLRRTQREDVDTWDVGTVAKVLHDLSKWYSLEIIRTRLETLHLAVSRSEFGDSFLKDRFVPYHPFFVAAQKPPLENPTARIPAVITSWRCSMTRSAAISSRSRPPGACTSRCGMTRRSCVLGAGKNRRQACRRPEAPFRKSRI
jgi:hypothetical protein